MWLVVLWCSAPQRNKFGTYNSRTCDPTPANASRERYKWIGALTDQVPIQPSERSLRYYRQCCMHRALLHVTQFDFLLKGTDGVFLSRFGKRLTRNIPAFRYQWDALQWANHLSPPTFFPDPPHRAKNELDSGESRESRTVQEGGE